MLMYLFFFFNDTATTEIYTLSLHDALPIFGGIDIPFQYIRQALQHKKHVVSSNKKVLATHYKELVNMAKKNGVILAFEASVDRKSTRLNSSHANISYAVFCLKKKKIETQCS